MSCRSGLGQAGPGQETELRVGSYVADIPVVRGPLAGVCQRPTACLVTRVRVAARANEATGGALTGSCRLDALTSTSLPCPRTCLVKLEEACGWSFGWGNWRIN